MDLNDTLKIIENVRKEKNFSFANNTTYGLGGIAKEAYFPKSIRQACAVFSYLSNENSRMVILGNGSNVLASDGYFNGAVISTKLLTGVYRTGENTVFCRAGTKVSSFLKYCVNNGLGGLENLAGIPATVGGLLYMNGGAAGKYIGDSVLSVKIFDGKIRNIPNKYCQFGYKYSIMRNINGLILGAELKLTQKNSETVNSEIARYLEMRTCQPKGKSCGCVFKNNGGVSAGKIIEECGLKGLSLGGAKVSEEHANFIINDGASSAEVRSLINEVKQRVFKRSGILLEEEVVYIGDI